MTRALLLLCTVLLAQVACSPARILSPTPPMAELESTTIPDPVFSESLRVYRGGDPRGPTVVLVHGIGDEASSVWSSLVPHLIDDYDVVAFDLPGFGGSPGRNALYTPKNYARVLEHVISEFAEPPVYLAGHSLGGAIALEYVGRHPDKVAHLFLISVPGILHEGAYTSYLVRANRSGPNADTDQGSGLADRITARLLRKIIRKTPDAEGIMESERWRGFVLGGDPQRIAGFSVAITDFSQPLTELQTPTSVFWGREDEVAPPRSARMLAAMTPGRDLNVFDQSGHVPMTAQPDAFNRRFLQRLHHGNPDPPTWPAPAETPGSRTVRCNDHRDGMTIEGRHRLVVIEDCDDVLLDRVTAERIEIHRSRVNLREPRIVGDHTGLVLTHSDVMITAGRITADTPIAMNSTFLDIAGTVLQGEDSVILGIGHEANEITASVTQGVTRALSLRLHGVYALHPGETL